MRNQASWLNVKFDLLYALTYLFSNVPVFKVNKTLSSGIYRRVIEVSG